MHVCVCACVCICVHTEEIIHESLSACVHSKIFADDTKVYTDALSSEQRILSHGSVDRLLVWSNEWQMKFNNNINK